MNNSPKVQFIRLKLNWSDIACSCGGKQLGEYSILLGDNCAIAVALKDIFPDVFVR